MLSYNEVTSKKVIILSGTPHEVLSSWVFRKQQRKPVNQTKLRNLKTGGMVEHTFHQSDKVEEADLEIKTIQFIYSRGGEYWFMDPNNPKDRFPLPETLVGETGNYLKEKMEVDAVLFDEKIMILRIPIKVVLEVTDAPPNIKGNTAQGGDKLVTLETGAVVTTPMFVETGDKIVVNTTTGEYVERAKT